MFCPECKSEYVEGIIECGECNVPLVDELPPEPTFEYENFVTLKTYSTRYEAELGKSVLVANGVDALIASDDAGGVRPELAFLRGVKLLVREEDAPKAQEIFQALESAQEESQETPEQ
jgi:hypothetical protein